MPGPRRSEVAALAGVSVEHDAELERGAIAGASSSVLEAVAAALRLDETERAHLLDLAMRDLTLAYEELAVTAEPGHVLLICTAEPGSPSAERLRLLASWGADQHAAVPGPTRP
ncbi:hypothetical protein [Kocuria sp. NPDC057446]|uniref:MmyB family transcriptional regulator n=1 Tax=Kocuria sp. NPDC057446 TaxID=3346137 RepID=UPI00368B4717